MEHNGLVSERLVHLTSLFLCHFLLLYSLLDHRLRHCRLSSVSCSAASFMSFSFIYTCNAVHLFLLPLQLNCSIFRLDLLGVLGMAGAKTCFIENKILWRRIKRHGSKNTVIVVPKSITNQLITEAQGCSDSSLNTTRT